MQGYTTNEGWPRLLKISGSFHVTTLPLIKSLTMKVRHIYSHDNTVEKLIITDNPCPDLLIYFSSLMHLLHSLLPIK